MSIRELRRQEGGGTGGQDNTGSNVGGGVELYRDKIGATLNFKTLVPGPNTTITPAADTVTIAAIIPDYFFGNVLSLVNYSEQVDGTTIADSITDPAVGNSWTFQGGASIVSGELVLNGGYLIHDDTLGFRNEFNGQFSAYWTLEFKIRTGAVSQPDIMMLFDWRDSGTAQGLSIQILPTNAFRLNVGGGTAGWDFQLDSTLLAQADTDYEICVGRGLSGYVLWINGQYIGIGTTGEILVLGAVGCRFGALHDGTLNFNGTYYRMRFTRKITRYIANDYVPEAGNSYSI